MESNKTQQDLERMQMEARANPGGRVYEIDYPYKDKEKIPTEAIKGSWKVDEAGKLTTFFETNPNYRPVEIPQRSPQKYMIDAADFQIANNNGLANQWVIESDPEYGHLFPNIPPEGIIGSWRVGSDGKYTGEFRPNHLYHGKIES